MFVCRNSIVIITAAIFSVTIILILRTAVTMYINV